MGNTLFVNPEVIGNIIGALISFILGVFAVYITQWWLERRHRVQITYSKTSELPLVLAKEELKDKLRIFYQESEVDKLYFFHLKIANTGKKVIKNQSFTCLFSEGAKIIDPSFPRISTIPSREVGPITLDPNASSDNEWRYTIEVLGISQIANIDFLMVGGKGTKFEVVFRSSTEMEVNYVEGHVSEVLNLETHISNVLFGIIAYYATAKFFTFPLFGSGFGSIFGLPFLMLSFRSLKPAITGLIQILQEHKEPKINNDFYGTIHNAYVGETITMHTDTKPEQHLLD